MLFYKQSTAATIIVGPILDSTGAEYASAVIGDLSLSKNGGTLTALASAATLTYIANGQYTLVLTTGNTDTLGRNQITCNKATYQMPMAELTVLQATVYDAIITNAAGGANGFVLSKASNIVDSNVISVGPTGANTNQSARDIGASVLLSAGSGPGQLDFFSGVVKSNLSQILGTALTETAGQLAAAFKKFFNIAAPASTMDALTLVATATNLTNAPTSGDFTATMKTSLNAATPASVQNIAAISSARVGYLDNLNVGGAVASHADILALNQSASKHLLIQTVGQYAQGEAYTIEVRTFDAVTGNAVNADSTPTITVTGAISGSLAANLGAVSNPATGVYQATYTNPSSPTLEQITASVSAVIATVTYTLSCYTQTVDSPTATFDSTDKSHLTSIFNKLPVNNIGDETLLLAAIGSPMQAYTQPTGFLAATFPSGTIANTTNITGGTITTATDLTNAPTNGDFTAAMKSSLNAATPQDSSGVTSLLSRLPAGLFTGLTNFANWLGALAGKQVPDSTAQAEIRATGAGSGTFDPTTDSLEAERDNIGLNGVALSAIPVIAHVTLVDNVTMTTSLTNAPTAGDLTAAMKSSVTTAATAATPKNDLTGAVGVAPWDTTTQADALKAAWAQGKGNWVLDLVAKTLTLYAPDGSTVFKTFNLDDATAPTQRT